MNVVPVTLVGRHVRLEPLSLDHHAALCEVALDEELWRWTVSQVRTAEDLRQYLQTALEWQAQGATLPFTIFAVDGGRAVGSTRYANIDPTNRRLEIGWTWVGRPWQHTPVNTETKYLLLRHAFETLGCVRVEFKTDALNAASRRALERIGAKEEGTLRSHMVTESGRLRDSVYYSILAGEWPAVKAFLEVQLRRAAR